MARPSKPATLIASPFNVGGDLPVKDMPSAAPGALTPDDIVAMKAQAEAEVAAEMAETRTKLYEQMKAEARAAHEREMKKQVAAVAAAEQSNERDHRGFPREYSFIEIQLGANPSDQQHVPLGVDGHFARIQRGRKVPVPNVFIGVLRDAVETKMSYDEVRNEIDFRDSPRFGFSVLGPATRAEYDAFKAAHPDA